MWMVGSVMAQSTDYPFRNVDLDIEKRVDDLISRLTVEEKVSQLLDVAPAIERLGIPQYNWWNECLHGVARAGRATSFPQAIGMAATWNPELIHKVADVISTEARAKYNTAVRQGQRNRYQGLTMWTPNINIFRDPRWGRGQETYGEDPYLTARLGVAFVKGLQGDDPDYLKVVATPKHYAVHSGPEHNRHSFDAYTTPKDLWETYLPAFEATVKEARAYSVMSAYNRYLGESATSSPFLLTDILRDKWGFDGYVVSDCGAVSDIYRFHKLVEKPEEAAARALKAGCDLNCGSTYKHLVTSLEQGLVSEEDINKALRRLLTARIRLGLLNPIEEQPFGELGEAHIESREHAELALQTARESMVLLKNANGILPLSKELSSIAVIGPQADDRHFLLGNYFGVPTNRTTILEGIREKVSTQTKVHYFKGVNVADEQPVFDVIPASHIPTGIIVEYYDNSKFEGEPVYREKASVVDFEWGGAAPVPAVRPGKFAIRYTGTIRSDVTKAFELAVLETGGSYRLFIDEEEFETGSSRKEHRLKSQVVHFEKDRDYRFRLEYSCTNEWMASVQLMWNREEVLGRDHLLKVAENSDVIVFAGGITARLEGEEMPVEVDGFYKGDRTHLKMPDAQLKLLKELEATGRPIVFLLTSGSAMAINWEQKHADAILGVWYPGQAGGRAVADVLFGDYNPSGKLPVTFYQSVDQLPDFEDYNMAGRTYRYFNNDPLYPFGYGLSYTTFEYGKPVLEKSVMRKGKDLKLFVDVKNTGEMDGETVVQLYVRKKDRSKHDPLKSLKQFQKISLKQGEEKRLSFTVSATDLQGIDDEGQSVLHPGIYEILIGDSSATENQVSLELR
jgi:beta-glucosidase